MDVYGVGVVLTEAVGTDVLRAQPDLADVLDRLCAVDPADRLTVTATQVALADLVPDPDRPWPRWATPA